MPDLEVTVGGRDTTLYTVLRGGRHVLVVPATDSAHLLAGSGLLPYWRDLEIVITTPRQSVIQRRQGAAPVILIRPDGHVAAVGSPGSLHAVTSYFRTLFGQASAQQPHVHSNSA